MNKIAAKLQTPMWATMSGENSVPDLIQWRIDMKTGAAEILRLEAIVERQREALAVARLEFHQIAEEILSGKCTIEIVVLDKIRQIAEQGSKTIRAALEAEKERTNV